MAYFPIIIILIALIPSSFGTINRCCNVGPLGDLETSLDELGNGCNSIANDLDILEERMVALVQSCDSKLDIYREFLEREEEFHGGPAGPPGNQG